MTRVCLKTSAMQNVKCKRTSNWKHWSSLIVTFYQGPLLQRDLNVNLSRALPCCCPVGWPGHPHQVVRNPPGKKRAVQMSIASIPITPHHPPLHHLNCALYPGGLPLYAEFCIFAQNSEQPNWNKKIPGCWGEGLQSFLRNFCQIAFNEICLSDMIDALCFKYCQGIIDANTILHFLTRHLSKLWVSMHCAGSNLLTTYI